MRWLTSFTFFLFWCGWIFNELFKIIFGRDNYIYSDVGDYVWWACFALGVFIYVFSYFRIERMYKKYSSELSNRQLTGFCIAEKIFDFAKLQGIKIEPSGYYDNSFYYSKKCRRVNLSERSCDKATVSAAGAAAHECAHMVQFEEDYLPIKLARIFGIILYAVCLSDIVIIGLPLFVSREIEYADWFRVVAIIVAVATVLIYLAMCVCVFMIESDANKRALNILSKLDVFTPYELEKIKNCLKYMFISSIIYEEK